VVAVLVDHRAIPMQHQEELKALIQFLVQLFLPVVDTVLDLEDKVVLVVVAVETAAIILMALIMVDQQFLDKETKVALITMAKVVVVVEQVVLD
jgi:hypothetical protein